MEVVRRRGVDERGAEGRDEVVLVEREVLEVESGRRVDLSGFCLSF